MCIRDRYKIVYYDSLNSSSGAVSAAYCPACSDYQFTQLFCMAQDINSVTATGIPTASTYPTAAGTADNRLAMAPYYLLYFKKISPLIDLFLEWSSLIVILSRYAKFS